MDQVIIGVKRNGLSLSFEKIKSQYDKSEYDCVCNVIQTYNYNGNGHYDISIVNSDFLEGFPINNWKIKEASISYDWCGQYSSFILIDENGVETSRINSGCNIKEFGIIPHVSSIFQKAHKIVSEYPDAEIFNQINKLNKQRDDDMWKKIDRVKEQKYITIEGFFDFLRNYLITYNKTVDMLVQSNGKGSKLLYHRIMKDFNENVEKIR